MKELEKAIQYLKSYNKISKELNTKSFNTLRVLMNITMPIHLSDEFYICCDTVLQSELKKKKIIDIKNLKPLKNNIYLYQGDITTIQSDAIVNACNDRLLGCFQPLHNCIDNAIHSFAGLQVRRDLIEIMKHQGFREENGKAKITKAYNLPSKYIIHTVGPIVRKAVTKENEIDLTNCYVSSLKLADEYKLENITFCSIAIGLYGYPIKEASKLAVKTVLKYLDENKDTSIKKVIFNVFSEGDYDIYKRTIEECD